MIVEKELWLLSLDLVPLHFHKNSSKSIFKISDKFPNFPCENYFELSKLDA